MRERLESRSTGTRLLLVAALLAVGLALAGVVMAGGAGDVTVETTPSHTDAAPGEAVTVDLVATVPEDGDVGAYTAEIGITDTDVAALTEFVPAGQPTYGGNATIADDGSSATVDVAYGDETLEADADGQVVLGTVTLEGVADGDAAVVPDVTAIGDGDGNSYEVVDHEPATVTVDDSASEPMPDPNWESELPGAIDESELYAAHDAVYPVTRTEVADGEYEYTLQALEADDGSERWTVTSDEFIQVAGVGDAVVAATGTGTQSELLAFDPDTGTEEWSYDGDSRFDYHATTLNADDGEVYAATDDEFVVLDAATGDVQGSVTEFGPRQLEWDDDTIYAADGNEVRAITRDGTQLWSEPAPADSYWRLERGPDGTVLVWDGDEAAVYDATDDPDGDRVLGTFTPGNGIDDAVAGDGQYLVTEGDFDSDLTDVHRIDADAGSERMLEVEGAHYEFYDGDHGTFLIGDALHRLDGDGTLVWTEAESVNDLTVSETDEHLVGALPGDDEERLLAFDPETGDAESLYETDDWITWTATDSEQVYAVGNTSAVAVEPLETVTVSGTVTSTDGTELAGDRIRFSELYGNDSDTAWTDADGAYDASVRPETTYSASYERTEPERNGVVDIYRFEPIDVGADDITIDWTVPEGDLLNVEVTDEDGTPIENASVRVADVRHYDENSYGWTGTGMQSTNADGLFEHRNADEPGIELTGDVRIEVEPPEGDERFVDERYETEFTLEEETTYTVELNETDTDLPPIVGDEPPQDLTGDGLHEDITGSGSLTVVDVQVLFDNLETDAVQDNAEAFAFGGDDGDVTVTDVQALWEEYTDGDEDEGDQ